MEEFELMAAPLEDYSDPLFRKQCYESGATSTFTEMARTAALARGNKSTLRKIEIPEEIPTYIQIVGSNEKELEKFLSSFEAPPGFLGFNFNLGCPSPRIISVGLGCALIKRISKVQRLVSLVKKYGFAVSIKMRLGLNAYEKKRKVYLHLIKEVDADFFIVHARHGQERDKNPADFSVYPECVATGKKIIANGDIRTKAQVDQLREMGLAGVMIGRAAIEDPRVFERLK